MARIEALEAALADMTAKRDGAERVCDLLDNQRREAAAALKETDTP